MVTETGNVWIDGHAILSKWPLKIRDLQNVYFHYKYNTFMNIIFNLQTKVNLTLVDEVTLRRK